MVSFKLMHSMTKRNKKKLKNSKSVYNFVVTVDEIEKSKHQLTVE